MTDKQIYIGEVAEFDNKSCKGIKTVESYYPSHFMVRNEDAFHVYKNKCPHTGAPLEWKPDQYLDHENEFIQCALHGALFKIETGECLRGPCLGKSLEKEETSVKDGKLYFIWRNSGSD